MLDGFHRRGAQSLLVSGGFTYFTDRLKRRAGLANAVETCSKSRAAGSPGAWKARSSDAAARPGRCARCGPISCAGTAVRAGRPARTTCRCSARPTCRSPYRAKPVVRAQATHAIDHCGLDAVLNLFA